MTRVDQATVEHALAAVMEHRWVTGTRCACGHEPVDYIDWRRHLVRAALDAALPQQLEQVARGALTLLDEMQRHVDATHAAAQALLATIGGGRPGGTP